LNPAGRQILAAADLTEAESTTSNANWILANELVVLDLDLDVASESSCIRTSVHC
jgi:hypothetical protein